MRTRVKICGITRLEDALASVEAGADALGFVFYPPSPRAIAIDQAAEIIGSLPAFVTSTALFVDADAGYIESVIRETNIDLLQFHGNESDDFCRKFDRPFMKAVRMKPELDLRSLFAAYPNARSFLLDAYRPDLPGGTGEQFDWSRIPEEIRSDILLAGGLDSTNVAKAISEVRPYAVDVSGGVEAAKGIKDAAKIKQFMGEVYRVSEY